MTTTQGETRRTLQVRQVKLYDNQGFGQPIVARTFLLPSAWQVAGGVQWNTGADPNKPAYYESFSCVSDDQYASFEMLPAYTWTWFTDPFMRQMIQQNGGQVSPPLDATGVVREYIIPNYRPDAVIVSVKHHDELELAVRKELLKAGLAQLEAQGSTMSMDFIEARLSYQINGIDYLEDVIVQLYRNDFPMTGTQSFSALNMYLLRAPKARWSEFEPIFATALMSQRQDPTWQKAINQFNNNMHQIRMKGFRDRQKIMSQMHQDIMKSNQESWDRRQESLDRSHREFVEYIREVETYNDPLTGSQVELPHDYGYAYSNGQGEYFLTNDPTFDPNIQLSTGSWQQLEVAP